MTASDYDRPNSLPDFSLPPLNEVVLGVQFESPSGYQQIYVGDVWKLYKKDYPIHQEQAPLPPSFETFGLSAQLPTAEFNLFSGAAHDRFWFLDVNGNELIQFQNDRLLHNWRKLGNSLSEYPRFNNMVSKFKKELVSFESFVNELSPQKLNINQCEISFINQISVDDYTGLEATNWLKFLSFDTKYPDDFSLTFRETILDAQGKAQGRLIIEAGSAVDSNRKKIIRLNLTVRGAPEKADIKSALSFLCIGHDLIVNRFAEITTDSAHHKWGRVK